MLSPLVLSGCVSSEGGLLGVAEIGAEQPADPAEKPQQVAAAEQGATGKTGRPAGQAAKAGDARAANGSISGSREIDKLIADAADANNVPRELAYAVVHVESRYNPKARGRGVYGLSQIKPATARSLGFSGPDEALLDPATNLRYGMKYLAGAWQQGGKDVCNASMKYKGGHRATSMTQSALSYCSNVKRHMAALSKAPLGTTQTAQLTRAEPSAAPAPARAEPVRVAANEPAASPVPAQKSRIAAALAPEARPAAARQAVQQAMNVPVPGHPTRAGGAAPIAKPAVAQGSVSNAPVVRAASAVPAVKAASAAPAVKVASAAPAARPASAAPAAARVAVPTHAMAAPAQVSAFVPVPQPASAAFADGPDPSRFGN